MAYTPTTWVNGVAPAINGTNLNNIEDGIVAADAAITVLEGDVTTLQSDVTTLDGRVDVLEPQLAAKQYRTSVYLPGSSGNWISTPTAASLNIAGDLEAVWIGIQPDWTPTGITTTFIGKWHTTGNQRSWLLRSNPNGTLNISVSVDGSATTISQTSTGLPPFVNGEPGGIKVTVDLDNGVGGSTVTFYYSLDEGENWTLLSTHTSTAMASIYASTAALGIGSYSGGTTQFLEGQTIYAEVRDGIGGTVVASPDFTTYINPVRKDNQGNVWTVNGSSTSWKRDDGTIVPIPAGCSYVTEAVGRQLWQWDNTNNRWQLTYFDTGERDVSASLDADWALAVSVGTFSIRRYGATVSLNARIQRVTASGNRNANDPLYTLPAGFSPQTYAMLAGAWSQTLIQTGAVLNIASLSRVDLRWPSGGTYAAGEDVSFIASWTVNTTAGLPSSLPGSAVGTIPST